MKLLIVESPKKAREIQHFLQSQERFLVKATVGHFKDLPKNDIGIDLTTYEPVFEYTDSKHKQNISEIKNLVKNVDEIYIATDPDREGYAIGKLFYDEIKSLAKNKNIYRVEFREITKEHILNQLKGKAVPFEKTNIGLFNAFLGRRVADRIVGYILSPKYIEKFKEKSFNGSLSVGRVQSPALRLIVERELEIRNFKPTPYWVLQATLSVKANHGKYPSDEREYEFKAFYEKSRFDSEEEPRIIYEDIKECKIAEVSNVEKQEMKRSPKAPFTTSTLQQEASRKLKFSPEKTMQLAQDLFETGFITYHRTDSTRISDQAVEQIRRLILQVYGEEFLPPSPRTYKSKNTQADAHEAVRITNFVSFEDNLARIKQKGLTDEHIKLFELIYRRTIACQMADAKLSKSIYYFDIKGSSGKVYKFKSSIVSVIFDGYLKAYNDDEESEDEIATIPRILQKGEICSVKAVNLLQKWTEPPSRYTEADLVKHLEELGIGRPSTYATIISTLKKRNYVKVEKNKLVPTDIGIALIEALKSDDTWIIDYEFTKNMEEFLDEIEENKKDWKEFVKIVHQKCNYTLEANMKKPSEKQIAFAKKLEQELKELGIALDLPDETLEDAKALSEWIDKAIKEKEKHFKSMPISEKQAELVNKHAPEDIKQALENKDYKTVRKWLDEWFKSLKKRNGKR